MRNLPRSFGAVLVGALTGIVLSIGTDQALHAAGVFPAIGQPMADRLLVWATVYRTLYGVLGSYLTALTAPRKPMVHAMVLGLLGLIANIAGAAVGWNRGQHWYPLALTVLALPTAWLGAKLFLLRQPGRDG